MLDFREKTAGLAAQIPCAHGPRGVLARFVERAEERATAIGVRLAFEQDFSELLAVHRESRKTGATLTSNFNPECGYDGRNGWWISARNAQDEVVATVAGRIYDWPQTSLAEELESFRFLYPDVAKSKLPTERCQVTAAFARKITGKVFYGGGQWIRPDMRGMGLSAIMPRLSKVYGMGCFNFSWAVAIVEAVLVRKGIAKRYGFNNLEFGVHYSGTRFGDHDCALVWLSRDEFVDDLVEVDRKPELLKG